MICEMSVLIFGHTHSQLSSIEMLHIKQNYNKRRRNIMKKIKQITIIMFLIIAIKMPVFAQKSCHVPILMYHHL